MKYLNSRLAHVAVGHKLAFLSIVPILALVFLASMTTVGHLKALNALSSYESLLPVLQTAASLVGSLEDEKRESIAFLATGEKIPTAGLSSLRTATDRAAVAFGKQSADLALALPGTKAMLSNIADQLIALRNRVDTTRFGIGAARATYDVIIDSLIEIYHLARQKAPSSELSAQTNAYLALTAALSLANNESYVLQSFFDDHVVPPAELARARDLGVEEGTRLKEFAADAAPALKTQYLLFVGGLASRTVQQQRYALSYRDKSPQHRLTNDEWDDAARIRIAELGNLQDSQFAHLRSVLDDGQQRVRRLLWRDAIVFCLALGLALLLTHAVRRSIINPLREVVHAANRLSEGEVDATVQYRGTDEMAEVSSAFRTLHRTVTNLTDEIGRLNVALKNGHVSVRGDATRFKGKWSEVVAGMNASLDEFATLHSKLARDAVRQATLRELGSCALEGIALSQLMQDIADAALSHLRADRCEIYRLDEGQQQQRCCTAGKPALVKGASPLVGRPDLWQHRAGTAIVPALHSDMDTAIATVIGGRNRQFGVFLIEYAGKLGERDDDLTSFAQVLGQILATAMQRQLAEDQLIHKAHHDALTGLANRTLFEQQLDGTVRELLPTARVLVLFFDLDRFKLVNDSYGHHVGDELLVQIADRLVRVVDSGDTLARFGGDEFAVFRMLSHHHQDVDAMSRRIARVFDQPFMIGSRRIYVTASIGITIGRHGSASSAQLIQEADTAMYRAKQSSSTETEYFSEELRNTVVRRVEIDHLLHVVLERDEISNAYQAIVDLHSDEPIGYEALARWAVTDWGHIEPSEFIPVAEENGLIQEIGEQLLLRACLETSALLAGDLSSPYVSVNVSVRQLERPDFAKVVARVLGVSGLAAQALCLEVTESAIMSDPERVLSTLQSLRELGVCLAVDDFGTGYSSFSYLTKLPVQVVKIDQSFIRELGSAGPTMSVVAAMCSLGHKLGLKVIAEGAETVEQVTLLKQLGVDAAQGFVYGRPGPLPSAGAEAISEVMLAGAQSRETRIKH